MSTELHSPAVLVSEYMRVGWTHYLPHAAFTLYEIAVRMEHEGLTGELDEQEPGGVIADRIVEIGDMDADPFALYGSCDDPDEARLVAEIRVDLRRAEASAGVEPVHTNRDLLELMRRLRLVERLSVGGRAAWRPVRPIPLPSERLLMTAAEKSAEDESRWEREHEETANLIHCLFRADDADVLTASIQEFAGRIERSGESVREAVLALLADPAFTATADIARVGPQQRFELRLDRDRWWHDRAEPDMAA